MADTKAAKPAEAESAPPAAPKKKSSLKVIAVAVAVVVLEIGTVGLTMKMSGGPKSAEADVPHSPPAQAVEKDVEVRILEKGTKLPNSQSGRLFLYDIEIFAKVNEKDKDKLVGLLKEREAEVQDRIRTIIASSDPKSLSEPGLETLRRQLGYQLEQDLGKDLIKELLIPRCTPFRAEF